MRALFKSVNLIGDGLNISPALREWCWHHQGWEVDIHTLGDHVACIYLGMGIPNLCQLIFEDPDNEPDPTVYDFSFTFDVGRAFTLGDQKKKHIAEAYAEMLGVQIPNVRPFYISASAALTYPPQAELPDGVILVSPFSKSCASQQGYPPNKMLPWAKWKTLFRYLRSLGRPIRILGGPEDRIPWQELEVDEREYYTGRPLPQVAWEMRNRASLIVTIDNGMSHLAASQVVPTFLLYPQCLGMHWIVPWGNPFVVPAQMDPAKVDPVGLVAAAKQAIPDLLKVTWAQRREELRKDVEIPG